MANIIHEGQICPHCNACAVKLPIDRLRVLYKARQKMVLRLRELFRQGQAEVVSNSKNKILATWEPFFCRALHSVYWLWCEHWRALALHGCEWYESIWCWSTRGKSLTRKLRLICQKWTALHVDNFNFNIYYLKSQHNYWPSILYLCFGSGLPCC